MATEKTEIWCKKNKDKIEVDERIKEEDIRGTYSIWVEDECVYVGKAINIKTRVNTHLEYLKNLVLNVKVKYIPDYTRVMYEAFNSGKKITVKLEDRVKYEYDNYNRDLHRLAFCEYKKIEEYQEKGWCLFQRPEGSYNDKEYVEWIKHRNSLKK